MNLVEYTIHVIIRCPNQYIGQLKKIDEPTVVYHISL